MPAVDQMLKLINIDRQQHSSVVFPSPVFVFLFPLQGNLSLPRCIDIGAASESREMRCADSLDPILISHVGHGLGIQSDDGGRCRSKAKIENGRRS